MTDRSRHPRILVVDDEEIVRESLKAWLEKDGYLVDSAVDGPDALAKAKAGHWPIVLLDLKMPGLDGLQVLEELRKLDPQVVVVMMTAFATVGTAVTAMKLGAYDYLVKPFDPEELSQLVHRVVEQQALVRENAVLRRACKRDYRFRDLLSKSPRMHAVFDLARCAANSPSTILVLGESGSGKELLARAIHFESPRRDGPFVAVSCAALTESLLESELFGYEKGAFTGAVAARRGKFELAKGGTLLLDEIGDVSPKLQMDLLRVLEERRFYRVGGTEPITADVRVIAATNRDLPKAVAAGEFREDLFYRLNVIAITLPPLRERKEDIPLLVQSFVERLGAELGRRVESVSGEAMDVLTAHHWPGNVRELRNVIERAIVVASSRIIEAKDLGLAPAGGTGADAPARSLEDVERRHIGLVLEESHGNVSRAARVLEIDRVTLYNKIRKYGLRKASEQHAGEPSPTR
jgi:two-component system, NtrC family, response regulator AtoC